MNTAARSPARGRVLFFESHPVQYKAPVYQCLQRLMPDGFEVIYATDVSVRRGNIDREFGAEVAWDTPLLSGYRYRVLGNEVGKPLSTPRSLSGRGVFSLLRREQPPAVVLTQLRYHFDLCAYFSALLLRIPILIRQETQDEMYRGTRSKLKELVRWMVYRLIYSPVQHAFAFGKLNYAHLVRHGIRSERITFARFSVPNPLEGMSRASIEHLRTQTRLALNIPPDKTVIGFFGKLIPKKNPELIFSAVEELSSSVRDSIHILFVGAGELMPNLKRLAATAQEKYSIATTFAGFVNQSAIAEYYLASDIVVLPSLRMGEAWGLVVNEALQAGCGVVVTDAVGCAEEFQELSRVKVIPVGGFLELARSIQELACLERAFDWAAKPMQSYSCETAAQVISETLLDWQRRVRSSLF